MTTEPETLPPKDDDDKDMTPDERMAWLRERGIQIVTPDERHAGAVANAMHAAVGGGIADEEEEISFVFLPADASRPMEQRTVKRPANSVSGDFLVEYLKTAFQAGGDKVDLDLLQQSATTTLAGGAPPQVSQQALRSVAMQGSVETFRLVHPVPCNQFTGINIYLDEAGMLKRLPLNTRATDLFAKRAGYDDPPPQFFGDVFLGRIVQRQSSSGRPVIQHLPFLLGRDTQPDAPWLQAAATDNLSYQMEMNKITGRDAGTTQPKVAGQDGKSKEEDDGAFSWTQTEEELEVVIPLEASSTTEIKSKMIKVKFLPQSVQVKLCDKEILAISKLFEHIDPDGCTWTLDRNDNSNKSDKDNDDNSTTVNLLLSLEKVETAYWPRIKD